MPTNQSNTSHPQDHIRTAIASAAARLIAEDGETYTSAKKKAAKQILGPTYSNSSDLLPNNDQVDEQIRVYHDLFFRDSQPERLRQLRLLALRIMEELDQFNPYLTGAVLNGTAGKHSDIQLQLYTDNNKDVVIYLLNRRIQFDVSETHHKHASRHEPQETLSFIMENEGIHLLLFSVDDLRQNSNKKTPRANAQALRNLLLEK